ncbi:YceI family protein [Pseudomonas guariconensis]|uniref:YceI family protein n=1 Tax=Pseudomonas TaxID=286 RepID=UPI001CE433C4|nr:MULTISPECIES: YceI family protein [Pseudomonas]MCO7635404.1 YceI family protein [Pseudomonas sp. S 311-6]MCO7514580.1 YceI family protein [Pseudomonas putida]MCO7563748.1 YceI family protein [Pseudomonas mosselii]MCO7595173.1 YceI family protein [Pseudomonas guariconensis]MCO7604633.1 YceI family protein [Pseudomonas guariconensis]
MFKLLRLLPALLLALCLPAHANWHLDGESSRLSFVTSKNGDTAEVHRFLVLHGKVDRKGLAQLRIEMDSVSGGVPLRDERMRNELFEVARFPEAQVQAQIDLGPINDLANGAQVELRLPVTVTLHGESRSYNVLLLATRLDERRFQVVTLEPLLLRAEDFGLMPGLATLRKLAGLSSISPSVPVSAVLIFAAR